MHGTWLHYRYKTLGKSIPNLHSSVTGRIVATGPSAKWCSCRWNCISHLLPGITSRNWAILDEVFWFVTPMTHSQTEAALVRCMVTATVVARRYWISLVVRPGIPVITSVWGRPHGFIHLGSYISRSPDRKSTR